MLKQGATVISIAGPPDPALAKEIGANPVIRLAIAALSYRIPGVPGGASLSSILTCS